MEKHQSNTNERWLICVTLCFCYIRYPEWVWLHGHTLWNEFQICNEYQIPKRLMQEGFETFFKRVFCVLSFLIQNYRRILNVIFASYFRDQIWLVCFGSLGYFPRLHSFYLLTFRQLFMFYIFIFCVYKLLVFFHIFSLIISCVFILYWIFEFHLLWIVVVFDAVFCSNYSEFLHIGNKKNENLQIIKSTWYH